MIDLHTHTIFSDGEDSVIEVLKKANKLGLNAISFTDHNTVAAYDELKNIEIKKYFKGKILKGVEIYASFEGYMIEILGYGIDTDKIKPFLKKYFSKEIIFENFKKRLKHLMAVCKTKGIKTENYPVEKMLEKGVSGGFFEDNLKKFPENKKFFSDEVWNNYTRFLRVCLSNPENDFYYNLAQEFPTAKEVVKAIKQSGGKAVFAHPFIYNIQKNALSEKTEINCVLDFAQRLLSNCHLDGIETYYSTFTKAQSKAVLNFAKQNNLIVTGGSDYHGKTRGWGLGTGINNNLKINKNLLLQFEDEDFFVQ